MGVITLIISWIIPLFFAFGCYNHAYRGYKAYNFHAGLVGFNDKESQELYLDSFYVKKAESQEWLLLKKDGFEYEKVFDFPENWQDQSAHPEYEWHLEKPDQHAQTTTELSFSGNRSAKLWTVPQPGKNVRSVLVAPDFTHWDNPLKKITIRFYLPEGQFGEFDAGVWLDVDLYDRENGKWYIAIVGFNREGLIKYGTGYGATGGQIDFASLDGGFILECNKWYKAELAANFSKFGDDDGMIFRLYIDGQEYEWKLPLTAWTDYMIYNFSFGAYYFGISNYLNYEAVAYFDEAEIYVGKEDTTIPTVQIVRPAPGCLLGSESVTISWEVDEPNLSSQYLELICPNGTVRSWQLDPNTRNFTIYGLEEGLFNVSIYAYDTAGNKGYDTTYFTVDLTPPSLRITHPEEGSILNSTTIMVAWTLSDAYGVAELSLAIDGFEVKTIFNPEDIDSVEVLAPEGWHTLRAIARDYANHTSEVVLTFAVDVTPPFIQILAPTNHSSVSEENLTIEWRVDDSIGIQTVSLYLNDTHIADLDPTTTSYTLLLTQGIHIIRLVATDFAGHTAVASVVVSVTASVAPTLVPFILPILISAVAAAIIAAIALLLRRRQRRTQ